MRTGLTHRRRCPAAAVAAFLLVLGGCASYSRSFGKVAREVAEGRPARALEVLDDQGHADRDELLYRMDRAILLRMEGRLTESNGELARAKALVESLSALSVREQATGLALTDAARSYAGAPYEQVLIHLYSALNYLELGELEEARVEALQVDLRVRELAEKDRDAAFSAHPFARYLSAMIFEERREWSDAMIAYRKAYEAYRDRKEPIPEQLQIDLLRHAERMGLVEERREYERVFGRTEWPPLAELEERGELVFLFHNGLAPVKVARSVTVPTPGGQIVRVSVPTYERRPPGASRARVSAGGGHGDTEVVEGIAASAIADQEAHRPGIIARMVARATVKYVASRAVGEKNEIAGLLVNLAGVLTEQADTRSWLTLPDEIQMVRLPLAPGIHDVEVEVIGPRGEVVDTRRFPGVEIRRGRKTYLSCHWVSPRSVMRSGR